MNDLQKVEFEILLEFLLICKELDLRYYLICGSALGAVKYNGFIPWDDDIDVAMPRDDYEVFTEKANTLLPKHYFLQNHKTDGKCLHFCSKIRDSRTTYIESDQNYIDMNHGVFIDVIPLDCLPNDKYFSKKYRLFRICQLTYLQSREHYKNIVKKLCKPFVNIKFVYRTFEKYLKKYGNNEANAYCNFHNSKNKLYFDKSVYGEGKRAVFEGVEVVVPEKYDEYFSAYYGDWRVEPPLDKQVGHHYCDVCDLTRSYKDYVVRLPNGKIRIRSKEELEN